MCLVSKFSSPPCTEDILTSYRLVLYYPVSALVTLFANILQNPQDTRARSDLKLMGSVVQFLQLLCQEDNNAHCRRMLSICAEFERIARVSLDKAEREIRGRGKRKSTDKDKDFPIAKEPRQSQPTQGQTLRTPSMPASSLPSGRPDMSSPSIQVNNSVANSPYGQSPYGNIPFPSATQAPYQANGDLSNGAWINNGQGNSPMFQQNQTQPSFTPFQPDPNFAPDYGMDNGDMMMNASFQQPFVPQDLWQMPMTLEWDMADIFGLGGANANFNFGGGNFDGGSGNQQQ